MRLSSKDQRDKMWLPCQSDFAMRFPSKGQAGNRREANRSYGVRRMTETDLLNQIEKHDPVQKALEGGPDE